MEKVDLRLDHEGKPMVINSCIHVIENKEMACHLLEKALSKRATKTTYMNDHSSRSHCVISFRLVGNNHLTGEERKSVVHFIDLAVRCCQLVVHVLIFFIVGFRTIIKIRKW